MKALEPDEEIDLEGFDLQGRRRSDYRPGRTVKRIKILESQEKEYKMLGFYGILILTGRGVLSRLCPD